MNDMIALRNALLKFRDAKEWVASDSYDGIDQRGRELLEEADMLARYALVDTQLADPTCPLPDAWLQHRHKPGKHEIFAHVGDERPMVGEFGGYTHNEPLPMKVIPPGWQPVPQVPTPEMRSAGAHHNAGFNPTEAYRAMLREAARITDPDTTLRIYVASRASILERGRMWRQLRARGAPIISTWIDEDGKGQTKSFGDLWLRILDEISQCSFLVLYADQDDFPLKGALVEAGAALALGKEVRVVLGPNIKHMSIQTMFGSWTSHPKVVEYPDVDTAVGFTSHAHASTVSAAT